MPEAQPLPGSCASYQAGGIGGRCGGASKAGWERGTGLCTAVQQRFGTRTVRFRRSSLGKPWFKYTTVGGGASWTSPMPERAKAALEFIVRPPRELSRNRNMTWPSTTTGNPHDGKLRYLIGHCWPEEEPKWGVLTIASRDQGGGLGKVDSRTSVIRESQKPEGSMDRVGRCVHKKPSPSVYHPARERSR